MTKSGKTLLLIGVDSKRLLSVRLALQSPGVKLAGVAFASSHLAEDVRQTEVLLQAAMNGNSTRFQRQDGVEETWRIMSRLITEPPPVHPYAPGTWGPAAADALVSEYGGWRKPWM